MLANHRVNKMSIGDPKIFGALTLMTLSLIIPVAGAESTPLIFKDTLRFIEFAIAYKVLLNLPVPITSWLKLLVAAGCGEAIIGILQFIAHAPLGLHMFGEPRALVEISGTFPKTSYYASYLVLSFFMLILFVYERNKSVRFHKLEWRTIYMIFALLAIALVLSLSLPNWVALVLGLALLTSQYRPKWLVKGIIIASLVSLPIVATQLMSAESSLKLFNSQKFSEQIGLSETGLEIFKNQPLGIGSSHFLLELNHRNTYNNNIVDLPPNAFLLFTVENGIFGFVALVLMWYVLTRHVWQMRNHTEGAILGSLLFALFILWNFSHNFVSSHSLGMYFWIFATILSMNIEEHLTNDKF
jgi:hypothetical protein